MPEHRITALLTGKKNSGLKNKNILPVLARPIVSYPAASARKSKFISYFYASSDDERILKIAGEMGYSRIFRPKKLAAANSKHVDAILHALKFMKKRDGIIPDILVVLLANSVSIKTEWIDACVGMILKDKNASAIVPVSLNLDRHPFRAKKINKKGYLEPFFDFGGKRVSTNRQELEPSYFLCHNFWVLNVKKSVFSTIGQPPWSFMGNKVKPFIVGECCDVHTKEDIERAKEWVRNNRDNKMGCLAAAGKNRQHRENKGML